MPNAPRTHRPAGAPTKQESRRRYDRVRDANQPWRKWYKSQRWVKSRAVFLKHHPLCVECEKEKRLVTATVVDHITPHRGNYELFWDVKGNWQPLCKRHHDMKTRRGQ